MVAVLVLAVVVVVRRGRPPGRPRGRCGSCGSWWLSACRADLYLLVFLALVVMAIEASDAGRAGGVCLSVCGVDMLCWFSSRWWW